MTRHEPMKKPELLCPAGSMEALEAALHFGADAVYGGMKRFGLRAFAGNFDEEQLQELVKSGGSSFQVPWFGQLMSGPQLLAHLAQMDIWFDEYGVQLIES